MSDIYVVVHVATTCDESTTYVTKDSAEVIEWAWAVVDAQSLATVHRQSVLVRPVNTPITPYCSQLHGVSWEHVRAAGSFKDAVQQFDAYVQRELIGKGLEFSFVTADIAKLRVQLPREARDKGVALPAYLQHPRVFDLAVEYAKWQQYHPESLSYPPSSLQNVITALEVDVDDNSPTAETKAPSTVHIYTQILAQLVRKSMPVEDHPSVLTKPYDSAQDVKVFLQERSKILYLANLPPGTTQSELESWFTQFGGRPIAFWTLKHADADGGASSAPKSWRSGANNGHGIAGFAVFGSHEEATESLAMNGRVLNDRAIEVQPSSTRVLDSAAEVLTPFPPSKNRPRPGDWTCPSCGFSNFQRRTHCFRCSFPASSAVAIQESIYSSGQPSSAPPRRQTDPDKQFNTNLINAAAATALSYGNYGNYQAPAPQPRQPYPNNVPFRAGDWKCDVCMYHNFAKNICCLKCQSTKPAMLQNHPHHHHNPVAHPVNPTAAAIAAATASGQPLSVNGFVAPPSLYSASSSNGSTPHKSSRNNSLTYAKQKPQHTGDSLASMGSGSMGSLGSSVAESFNTQKWGPPAPPTVNSAAAAAAAALGQRTPSRQSFPFHGQPHQQQQQQPQQGQSDSAFNLLGSMNSLNLN
ncbi:hypothetical protein DIRU0_E31670 [Diutina rugosa]